MEDSSAWLLKPILRTTMVNPTQAFSLRPKAHSLKFSKQMVDTAGAQQLLILNLRAYQLKLQGLYIEAPTLS